MGGTRRAEQGGRAEEGGARGKAVRRSLPRRAHASVAGPDDDPFDGVAVLAARDAERIPELVAVRYRRMLPDPFTFLRGAAELMARDLSRQPHTGIGVQLCGDAHLGNFGMFATPERRLVFGVNDFDETLPGPWEWDVKRLAASLHVAGRVSGFSESSCEGAVAGAVAGYRRRMADLAGMATLDVWYAQVDVSSLLEQVDGRVGARVAVAAERARRRDQARALVRLTERDPAGRFRFRHDPPLLVPLDPAGAAVAGAADVLERYRDSLPADRRVLLGRYGLVDVARKVVGVGSVGTRCLVALLEAAPGDHLILQLKEAGPSALEPFLGPSPLAHHGQRVVLGQRLMQPATDLFLGWTGSAGAGTDFYVRQLWDQKGGADVDALSAADLGRYGQLCGVALALAHARSGDSAAIEGYLGRSDAFDVALTTFAAAYADRTEHQHQALVDAVRRGRLPGVAATDAP